MYYYITDIIVLSATLDMSSHISHINCFFFKNHFLL